MIYKVVADWDKIDFDSVFKSISTSVEGLCFTEDNLYINHMESNEKIETLLKRSGLKDFFHKEVPTTPITENNTLQTWCADIFRKEKMEIDRKGQAEIQERNEQAIKKLMELQEWKVETQSKNN